MVIAKVAALRASPWQREEIPQGMGGFNSENTEEKRRHSQEDGPAGGRHQRHASTIEGGIGGASGLVVGLGGSVLAECDNLANRAMNRRKHSRTVSDWSGMLDRDPTGELPNLNLEPSMRLGSPSGSKSPPPSRGKSPPLPTVGEQEVDSAYSTGTTMSPRARAFSEASRTRTRSHDVSVKDLDLDLDLEI